MINLEKLEAELKLITSEIVSISNKVSNKWAPSSGNSYPDADGDNVGVCWKSDVSDPVKAQVAAAILSHSKASTDNQKLNEADKKMDAAVGPALLVAVDAIIKAGAVPQWAKDVLSAEAAKIPAVSDVEILA